MDLLLLGGSAFGAVFLLGFQSLCVNAGHRLLAVLNSVLIGVMNIGLFKLVPHVHTAAQIAVYLSFGPLGILAAMQVHAWLARRRQRLSWPTLDKA